MCWSVFIQWKAFLVCLHHHKCVQGDWMLCEVSLILLKMKIKKWLRRLIGANPNKKEFMSHLFNNHPTPILKIMKLT